MMRVTLLAVGMLAGAAGGYFLPKVFDTNTANQPYADEQGRAISSLSVKDVEELRKGAGWGLAKPAEFNGYPGPSHIIEFADKLSLTSAQRTAIDASFAAMQAKAKQLGVQLIEAEQALDAAFIDKSVTPTVLREKLAITEKVRAQLREVHLAAHLEVTPVLNEAQKTRYAELRGYGSGHSGHTGH